MDNFQIPPQLMGVAGTPAAPPMGALPPAGPTPGQMTPPSGFGPPPMDPMAGQVQGLSTAPMGPTPGGIDPTLTGLLQRPSTIIDPELFLSKTQRKGYVPMPDEGHTDQAITSDQQRYQRLLARFAYDLAMYRQKSPPNVPPGFDWQKEIAFKTATISNIVNKLTNMSSAADWRYIIPFKDEQSKNNSQIAENWLTYLRKCEVNAYSRGGGSASLQWDEFWYLFQYGRVVARILPDPSDLNHPFHEDLIDPAVCFPLFGNTKEGLIRMTMTYDAKVSDVIRTFGRYDPNLQNKIIAKLGYTRQDVGLYLNENGTVTEYWDTWNRRVKFRDVVVVEGPHELGFVPFVYVTARGEPAGQGTPRNGTYEIDEFNNAIGASGTREELEEKGISVYHHIRNTNRMTEVVYTLLISEVLKAQNPAMIEYIAPQLWGSPPPPMKHGPGASNKRFLNQQKAEIVPTSPRPTDTSPVINKVQADIVEGSVNPAMYGSMDGSNIAGFAVESLMSAARDTILPYTQAFQTFQALKAEMKQRMWVKTIFPISGGMLTPMEGEYGSSPSAEVTPEVIRSTGYKVEVEMIGVSDQALPGLVQVAGQAIEQGIWSRRKAMEKLGEKDPSKMLQDIILERAIEHPEIMENIIIPQMFIKNGQNDLAQFWAIQVVMPKVMQNMQSIMMGMGGGMPPGMPGAGPPPPSGPQQNGQSNPMVGRARGRPTGPQPGQGRQ